MAVLITILVVILGFLFYEKLKIEKYRRSVSICIAVTGTRGKSGIVRQLASVFSESSMTVLAKITGTEPAYILPDGSSETINRRGVASIIEQVRLLKKAHSLKVNCIIVELMSIHPENHFVEARQILKPEIVIISNIRVDHIDAMGKTREEIAEVLCMAIPRRVKLFVPQKEMVEVLEKYAIKNSITLKSITTDYSSMIFKTSTVQGKLTFPENINLIAAVSKDLNIPDNDIINGINNAENDPGSTGIFKYTENGSGKTVFLVNAFSANDPVSTDIILKRIKEILTESSGRVTGLIALRKDRADRTEQWLKALNNGFSEQFIQVYSIGVHSNILLKKSAVNGVIMEREAETITRKIISLAENDSIIFGLGNMVGTGRELTDHWKEIGVEYGI